MFLAFFSGSNVTAILKKCYSGKLEPSSIFAVAEKTERQTAGQEITRRIRQAGRTMQADVMQGPGSAICCSMRVTVFYHRSVGERCSSNRYRLQTRHDQKRAASVNSAGTPTWSIPREIGSALSS